MNTFLTSFRYLFVLCIFALPFAACSNDDDSDDGNGGDNNELVGQWQVVYSETTNCDDPFDNNVLDLTMDNCIDVLGIETCYDIVFELKADGTQATTTTTTVTLPGQQPTMNTETSTGTYTVNGNDVTVCDDDSGECNTLSYSITGNTVTFTGEDSDGCDAELRANRI